MVAVANWPIRNLIRRRFLDVIVAFMIMTVSLAGYLEIANRFFERTRAYRRTVLGVDHFAVTRHMCDMRFSPKQHRTTAHPLFALFFRPLCRLTKKKMPMAIAAMRITLIFGAIGNVLFYFCLRKMGLKRLIAVIFTTILGLSVSHLIYGSIAETYIFVFTSLTLLLLIYLCVSNQKLFFVFCFAGTLFSTGVTTTNAVFGVLLYFFKIREKFKLLKALLMTLLFSLLLIVGLFALITLQNKMYPNLKDFFHETTVSSNTQFLRTDILDFPISALAHRLPHLFIFNEVAPGLVRNKPGFPGWVNVRPITIVTIAVYSMLIFFSGWAIVTQKAYRMKMFWPVSSYFLFNICFFLFYGYEPHLYYEHYTFSWIALLALPFASIGIPRSTERIGYLCALMLLPLLALNNLTFVESVLALR